MYERQQAPLPDVPVAQTPAEVRVKAVERNVETLDFSNAEAAKGCNEIFMQSQRVLAAEDAKDAELMPRSRPASGL